MTLPRLYHLPISHYSEKVRWALDWKRIRHVRRMVPPGTHPLWGVVLTRGRVATMPVLALDGRMIGDSTAIIAALEQRMADLSLYPADPALRARALELEDWFDENAGPHARTLVFNGAVGDPRALAELAAKNLEWAPVNASGAKFFTRMFVNVRYRVSALHAADRARAGALAAFDKLEESLGGREFLVGDRFSVADLTAASLLYPVVMPPEGPWVLRAVPKELEDFRASVRERPGWRWVEETFRRFRRPGGPEVEAPLAAGRG